MSDLKWVTLPGLPPPIPSCIFVPHSSCMCLAMLTCGLSLPVSEEQCLYQIYIDELYGGLQRPSEDEKKK